MRGMGMGQHTKGGLSTTKSHIISPLCDSTNAHAARSASVLLARYFCMGGASLPCCCMRSGASSFQLTSEKTCGEGGEVGELWMTAAQEEVITMRLTLNLGDAGGKDD